MPEVSLEDEPLGAQEPRPARRRGAPRHAAHSRGRRQRRALDRRDLRDRPHRLDRRRHGEPDRRARQRPAASKSAAACATRADLRVGDDDDIVRGRLGGRRRRAPCPTSPGGGVGGYCVPNAQHAVRQGKLLAKNIVAVLRGEEPEASTSTRTSAPSPASASVQRRVPVGQARAQGPHRLVRAPRLPRPRDAQLGAQVPRVLGLVEQLLARPRHRLAARVQSLARIFEEFAARPKV